MTWLSDLPQWAVLLVAFGAGLVTGLIALVVLTWWVNRVD